MKATYIEFVDKGVVAVKEEKVSEERLAGNEVLIRNETSIVSAGTELARLHGLEEGHGFDGFPSRPGYGSVGHIVAKGDEVSGYDVGDRVFYAGKHASAQRFEHGASHQWGSLFPVPEEIDAIDAAVGCMAEIAMTAPNATELALNDTVAVFGLGMVGVLAAQAYQLRGARMIGVDPVKERCELARKVGIETVLDVAPDQQVTAVREHTGGEGAMVTVDATGLTAAVLNCIEATAPFGQVVLVGSPRAPLQADVTLPFSTIHTNGLVVRGAHMWRYPLHSDRNSPRSVDWVFETTFDLIRTGKLKVRELISHVIAPAEVPRAYDGLLNRRDEYTGVVIDWR
ncbi:MAG: zinc-binding dehydrogenase [Chitinivibrionales bacterium]|nr:zinc-binding dehydrogenase [Chitinivibrionales bacterium]